MIRNILDTLAAATWRDLLADLVKLVAVIGIVCAIMVIAFAFAPYTPHP